jgi:hypothetical protein
VRTHHLAAAPEGLHRPIHLQMTTAGRSRFEFDGLLRHLVTVGVAALLTWAAIGAVGLFAGYTTVDTHQVLKFLLAVLLLVFARRTYWEMRKWRWKRMPAVERYGSRARSGRRHAVASTSATARRCRPPQRIRNKSRSRIRRWVGAPDRRPRNRTP